MNYLWLDVETTGRYADKHDIVQLACIPVINGVRQKEFNQYCQPLNWKDIEPEALDVNGLTFDRLRTFQSPINMMDNFIKYCKSFGVKFTLAGYNCHDFDRKFVSYFFSKLNKNKEHFEIFSLDVHDTYLRAKSVKDRLQTENLKLVTLAAKYNIAINAHDALSDISATITVDEKISELLGESSYIYNKAVLPEQISVNCKFKEPAQLHLHSQFDMKDSTPHPVDWLKWCLANNVPGFSIVDQGPAISIFHMTRVSDALTQLSNKAKSAGKPEIPQGAVVGVPGLGLNVRLDLASSETYALNAWAVSNDGVNNLIKLSSIGYENAIEVNDNKFPTVTLDQVLEYKSGLKFGTACINGAVAKPLKAGNVVAAEQNLLKLKEVFGSDLYAEFNPVDITHQYVPKVGFQKYKIDDFNKDGNIQHAYNLFLANLVDKYQLKCIPVSGAHFINKEDKIIQDTICKNSNKDGAYYRESYHAKTGQQLFKELKCHLGDWLTEDKFKEWIDNSYEIVELAKAIKVKHQYHLPVIDIPDNIKAKTSDYNKQTYYYMMERIKLHGRWIDDPVYLERFKKEVDVIMNNSTLNFIPYFLVYDDFCDYARSINVMQNIARGSAGGCLISYYLKIIHVDPIKADLPFERFLSHARINAGSFPDIDCDFADRAPIVEYLKKKYRAGFAQISTFNKMKTKNAIKDAMYALYGRQRNDPEITDVCDTIPDSPQGIEEKDFLYGYTDSEGIVHSGHVQQNEQLANFFKHYPEVESIVRRLLGTIRGWSRHASAFVISTLDLSGGRVPTLDMDGVQVTQYDAAMVEKCNLVKADILVVSTLQAVSEAIQLIKQRTGQDLLTENSVGVAEIYRLPDERSVYADFYNKQTDSSFQFNTDLIKGYLQRFIPTTRQHLADMTALCRPGALDAPFTNDEIALDDGVTAAQYYMDVRGGVRELSYLNKDLAACTTNGVFVYQEEVMKFLVELVGYSWESSDQIRSAIAKKKREVIMATYSTIRERLGARGWTEEQIEVVCRQIEAFSRYSFNRSHAYAYGELGYITMYLKHFFPLEWWTAVLNTHTRGDDEDKLRKDIELLGSLVKPPTITQPHKWFTIQGNNIVAPISAVKSLGMNTVDHIIAAGEITSIEDYVNKINHAKVNIGAFSALVKARAVDDLMDKQLPYEQARLKLLEDYRKFRKKKLKTFYSDFNPEIKEADAVQIFLMERDYNKCFNKNLLEEPSIRKKLMETWPGLKETGRRNLPFSIGKVPIVSGVKAAEELLKHKYDKDVGMIMLFQESAVKEGLSKKNGKPYAFLKVLLSDGYQAIECTQWSRDKSKPQPLRWKQNTIVYVRGTLKPGFRSPVSLDILEIDKIDW